MSITRKRTSAALALTVALPALAAASPALANPQVMPVQPQIGATDVQTLPPASMPVLGGTPAGPIATGSIATGPAPTAPIGQRPSYSERTEIGPDGVETIIRTRYITRQAPAAPTQPAYSQPTYAQPRYGYGTPVYPSAPTPVVFERDQWLDECERRTRGRSEKEKGGIIGGLLGAAAGGVAGNVIAGAGERLAGTLIGAGTGGLAGLLIGSLIGGGKKGDRYDCEAALDGYISQYGQPGAARTITYPYPPAGYGYQATGQYGYYSSCGCQAPQMVMVPIRTQVRQRLITRETVTTTQVPGERFIPPAPIPIKTRPLSPKLIKQR